MRLTSFVQPAEIQHAGGTHLNASRATDTFRILHRQTFVRKIHDIDALMTNGSANIAGNALFLIRKNPEARESRIDVHQRRERTSKTAPDASAEPEIHSNTYDTRQKNVNHMIVVQLNAIDRKIGKQRSEELACRLTDRR